MNEVVIHILSVLFPICMSLTVVMFIIRNWIWDTKWRIEYKQMLMWIVIGVSFYIATFSAFPFVWDDFAKLTLKEVPCDNE